MRGRSISIRPIRRSASIASGSRRCRLFSGASRTTRSRVRSQTWEAVHGHDSTTASATKPKAALSSLHSGSTAVSSARERPTTRGEWSHIAALCYSPRNRACRSVSSSSRQFLFTFTCSSRRHLRPKKDSSSPRAVGSNLFQLLSALADEQSPFGIPVRRRWLRRYGASSPPPRNDR